MITAAIVHRFNFYEQRCKTGLMGARIYGGHWNSKGRAMVCSSESTSLTVLEQLMHVADPAVLDAFAVVYATLDESAIEVLSSTSLPEDWRAYPTSPSLKKIGDT